LEGDLEERKATDGVRESRRYGVVVEAADGEFVLVPREFDIQGVRLGDPGRPRIPVVC
jgi:hypothetical protein